MRKPDEIHDRTIEVYEQYAKAWDTHRSRDLFEKNWLDQFIELLPANAHVLDVGCGSGEPISQYLLQHGLKLTGLDASLKMLEISQSRFPNAHWVKMDMREIELETKFDGIISWNGFFHLTQEEQHKVLHSFAEHLSAKGVLLLTIGHESGEVTGTVEGQQVYHSSLAPKEYKAILNSLGFTQIEIKLKDSTCGFHSILLAHRNP